MPVSEDLRLFASYYPDPLPLAQVLAQTGLTVLEQCLYGKLSGGQKQRPHRALALVGNPNLLFSDETDHEAGCGLEALSLERHTSLSVGGKTVLLTTHYLEEADALADRIMVLNQGNIIAKRTPH